MDIPDYIVEQKEHYINNELITIQYVTKEAIGSAF